MTTASLLRCPNCDAALDRNGNFCSHCGWQRSSVGKPTELLTPPRSLPYAPSRLVLITCVLCLIAIGYVLWPKATGAEQLQGTWVLGPLTFEFDVAGQQLHGFPVGTTTPSEFRVVQINGARIEALINNEPVVLELRCNNQALFMDPEGSVPTPPEILWRPGVAPIQGC